MRFKISIGINIFLILSNHFNSIIATPLIGDNVRIANEDEFSFVVSIKYLTDKHTKPEIGHMVTGSLISLQDVLTVAHAFNVLQSHRFEIVAGAIDIRYGTKYNPLCWTTYLQWASYNRNATQYEIDDVAIIKLTDSVKNEVTPVVTLPIPINALYGIKVQIAGWGRKYNGEKNRFLTTATLNTLSKNECEKKMRKLLGNIYLPENFMCSTAAPYILTVPGDNGGPILYRGTLVAIHKGIYPESVGDNSAKVNVHIPIHNFASFIEDIILYPD